MTSKTEQRPESFPPQAQGRFLACEVGGSCGLGKPQFSRVSCFSTMGCRGCGIENASEFSFVTTFHPQLGDSSGGDDSLSLRTLEFGTIGEHGFWGYPKVLCEFIYEMRC